MSSPYDDGEQAENDALIRRALLMQLMSSSPQSPAAAAGAAPQGSSPAAGTGAASLPESARQGIRQSPAAQGDYLGLNVSSLSPPRAPQVSSAEAYQSYLQALEHEALQQEQHLTRLLLSRRPAMPATTASRQQILNQLLSSSSGGTGTSDAAIDPSTLSTSELIRFHSQFGRGQQGGLLSEPSTAGRGMLPSSGLYPSLADSVRRNLQPLPYYPQAGLGHGGGMERIDPSQAQQFPRGQKRSLDESMALSPARRERLSEQEDLGRSPRETSETKKPKKRRRATKKKPDDMPRRPLSAYNLFFSEERERILRELSPSEDTSKEAPGEAGAASSSKDGDDKKTSSDDERKPAASPKPSEDSTEATQPQEGKTDTPTGPTCKALLRPLVLAGTRKRPHRKTHGKIGFKTLAQMVGQRWRSLPSDRLAYYQELADEDMKRHKQAMEEYYKKKGEKKG